MDTTFVNNSTVIVADWLNEINDHVWSDTPVAGTTVHDASVIANTPAGNIAATTVQAAINELDTEKLDANTTVINGTTIPASVTLLDTTDIGSTVQAYDANIATVVASQAEMEAGTEAANRVMSPLRVAQAITAQTTPLVFGTAIATTSGTSHDFTIPAGTNVIYISCVGVSTNGTSIPLIQLGDSGGIENSGYVGNVGTFGATSFNAAAFGGTGFGLSQAWSATTTLNGMITLTRQTGNTWAETQSTSSIASVLFTLGSGSKALSAELTTVRLTTTNGTDAFDAGSINVMYI